MVLIYPAVPVHPAVGWIVDSRAKIFYSSCSDKLIEVHARNMSASCQPGSRVIRAFSDVEKPFLFSDLVVNLD